MRFEPRVIASIANGKEIDRPYRVANEIEPERIAVLTVRHYRQLLPEVLESLSVK
jgi:hypothetical protein